MFVPNEVLRAVVFVGVEDSPTPIGTAFFVRANGGASYLVTAGHVAAVLDATEWWTRSRGPDGSTLQQTLAARWERHPETDLAVTQLEVPAAHLAVPWEMVENNALFESDLFGLGGDLFIPGLFSRHGGSGLEPILRFGNLSMMPTDAVHTATGLITAYLCELRSTGGLSGSPVFIAPHLLELGGGPGKYALLGVMQGHWDGEHLLGDRTAVNMGVGVVVPGRSLERLLG